MGGGGCSSASRFCAFSDEANPCGGPASKQNRNICRLHLKLSALTPGPAPKVSRDLLSREPRYRARRRYPPKAFRELDKSCLPLPLGSKLQMSTRLRFSALKKHNKTINKQEKDWCWIRQSSAAEALGAVGPGAMPPVTARMPTPVRLFPENFSPMLRATLSHRFRPAPGLQLQSRMIRASARTRVASSVQRCRPSSTLITAPRVARGTCRTAPQTIAQIRSTHGAVLAGVTLTKSALPPSSR